MTRIGQTGTYLAESTSPAFGTVTRTSFTRCLTQSAVEAARLAAAGRSINALVHVFTLHGVVDHIYSLIIDLK